MLDSWTCFRGSTCCTRSFSAFTSSSWHFVQPQWGKSPSVGTHAPPDSEALEALRSSWWTYVQSRDFQTRPRRSKFYPNNWDGLAAWTCDYNSWKKHGWLFLSQPIPSPIEVKMSEKESFWGDAISFEVKIHDFIKCLPWQVDWGYTWASRHKSIAIHTHPQGQSPSRERWHTWNTWAPHSELIWVENLRLGSPESLTINPNAVENLPS